LRVPFTGTKGPSPTPEKQPHTIIPPPPNFTLGTMQSGKYHSPCNFQTQTRPLDWQTEKRDSSFQKTRIYCSRVQWRFALHCTCGDLLCIALGDVSFQCSWSAMKTDSIELSTHCCTNLKVGGL
ncbi:unnamed protein product, partial [Staurois parvus]